MSTTEPDGEAAAQVGPSLTTALRQGCTGSVVLVDLEKRTAFPTANARGLLGLAGTGGVALEALPGALAGLAEGTLATDAPGAGQLVELSIPTGGNRTLEVTCLPVPGAPRPRQVVVVLHDLTLARQLDQHIAQLDRLADLGTLAAGMAHEIKNALVAGRTFMDLLLEKNPDAELASVVRRELGRIDAIVSRMLRFAGPGRAKFGPVHLHEILDHSLRLVHPQLVGKSIAVARSFRAAPDLAHGDEYGLQQAFVNLLLNALEAMSPSGTLTVATDLRSSGPGGALLREAGGAAQFCVAIKDTGTGIAPENLSRLFEPFFTTKPSGTGLGLAITQRIVQEHRGVITVESRPGQGTQFFVRLPVLGHPA